MTLPETINWPGRLGSEHRADHVALHKRFNQAINVKDATYGAVGDGVTDDTTGVQAAFDAAGTLGRPVYFPTGDYLCGTLNYRNQLLLGDGQDNSWITGKPSQDLLHADATLSYSSRPFGGIHRLTLRVNDTVDASASFPQRGGVGNACLAYDYPNGAVAAPLSLYHMHISDVDFRSTSETLDGQNKSCGVYTQNGGARSVFRHLRFYRLYYPWWGHYPTSNLTSTELAFDHCTWQDIYVNGCHFSGRWVNAAYSTWDNVVSHITSVGFEWLGVTSEIRASCSDNQLPLVYTEACASEPVKFTNCSTFDMGTLYTSGQHTVVNVALSDSRIRNWKLQNTSPPGAEIVLTGNNLTIEDLVMPGSGSAEYIWDQVDDQGSGNRVLHVNYFGPSEPRNRIPAALTRDARTLHERDSGSGLLGYVDPLFVSANDLLLRPDMVTPSGVTEGDLTNGYERIQDITTELGRALKVYASGWSTVADSYGFNGENGAVVGEFLPKGKVRVYIKAKLGTAGTQVFSLRYLAVTAGTDTFTLGTSYTVNYFDADLSAASDGDYLRLLANAPGGGGAAPCYLAWIMFRPYTADVLSSGNVNTYGKLGIGGLVGDVLIPTVSSGSGTPEGVLAAPIGSTYHRTNGGAGTSFYVKESGTGNTGWVAK